MDYRKLGQTGLNVSELCLGTMQFGWTTDAQHSAGVMDAFFAAGGNFIDTADIYTIWGPRGLAAAGEAEEIIGRWLVARGSRDQIVLATKVRGKMWEGPDGEGLSAARVIRCCEDSLRRLQTDHIDLYQCHWVDLNTPIHETLSALDTLVRAGKVRYKKSHCLLRRCAPRSVTLFENHYTSNALREANRPSANRGCRVVLARGRTNKFRPPNHR